MTAENPEAQAPQDEVDETETVTVTETRTVRHLVNRGEGLHILEAELPDIGGETTDDTPDEADRPATAGMGADYTYAANPDPTVHETDWSDLPDKVVPRHDKYAAENTGVVPQRVIPGGITNAHPDFTVGAATDTTTGAVLTSAPVPDDHVVREQSGAATPKADANAALTGEDTPKTGVAIPPVVSSEPVVTGPVTVTDEVAGVPPRQVVQTEPDPVTPPGPVPDGTVLSPVGDASHAPPPDPAPEPAPPPGIEDGKSVPATPTDSASGSATDGAGTEPAPAEVPPEPGPADIPPPPDVPTQPASS